MKKEVFVKNNKKMTMVIFGLLGLSTLSQKLISSDRGDGGYSTLAHPKDDKKLRSDRFRDRFFDQTREKTDLRKEKIELAKIAVINLLNKTAINREMIKEVLSGLKNYITENEEFENREFRESVLMSIFSTDDFEHDKDAVDLALEILIILDQVFGEYNKLGKYERLEVLKGL